MSNRNLSIHTFERFRLPGMMAGEPGKKVNLKFIRATGGVIRLLHYGNSPSGIG
jgi:hypothetical protein